MPVSALNEDVVEPSVRKWVFSPGTSSHVVLWQQDADLYGNVSTREPRAEDRFYLDGALWQSANYRVP